MTKLLRGRGGTRNIVGGRIRGLIRAVFWCGRVACASLLSLPGSLVALSYGAALRRDSIANNTEPKCVVRPVEVATRIDAHCNLAGRSRNAVSGFPRCLSCANRRRNFVA